MENIEIRSFAWHDLISLYRWRNQIIPLDSALVLTRGSPIGPIAALTRLQPSHGSFTGIARTPGSNSALIGQMVYRLGDRSARLSFFTPQDAAHTAPVTALVEGMAHVAGEWGAFNLLAELDEQSEALTGLRRAGFAVYARQRVWKLPVGHSNGKQKQGSWRPVTSVDELSVRSLYQCLVPPLAQGAETFPLQNFRGFIYKHKEETLAFVEGIYGPRGIYLIPLVHPTVEDVPGLLAELPQLLSPVLKLPVYISVRSYQSWLESALEETCTIVGPRQALLVKHLAHIQRVFATNGHRLTSLEHAKAEPTSPIVSNCGETVEMFQ